jgi:hypothetical protein
MIDLLSLSLALSVGQGPGLPPQVMPQPAVQQWTLPNALPTAPSPRQMPSLLTGGQTPSAMPSTLPTVPMSPTIHGTPATPAPATTKGDGNGNGGCANCEEKKEEEPAEEDEGSFFMNMLKGTALGEKMEKKRLSVSGWLQFSYTASHNVDVSNQPVVWNDRANRFLMQQAWLRLDKAVDKESKEASWGYRADLLFGTDYRFTLPRGTFNDQLKNSNGQQNLYGIDPIQYYLEYYMPNVLEGTTLTVGKMFCRFGYESIEGPTSPLLSRSYAFNFAPPFTHHGVMLTSQLNKQLLAEVMLANGNDVTIGDPSEEYRFTGKLAWTSEDEKTTVALGTSVGRGKFNAGDPFAPTTVGLLSENAGRNNINVFDLVFTRKVTDDFTYGLEVIYGYQYGVPTTVALPTVGSMIKNDATHGTAHWGSVVNYFTYSFNEKTTGIVRAEAFDDFEGQRTGFEGLYTAVTGGLQFKPNNWLMIRPEVRYDYNHESRPFEGKRSLFTAATDLVIRY